MVIASNQRGRSRLSLLSRTFFLCRTATLTGRGERMRGAVRSNVLSAIELFEERVIDFVCPYWSEAEFKLFEHVDEFLAVNQLDGRHTVT